VAEVVLLISLFCVGLKLGLPLLNRHWLFPLRLSFVSMAITVALIAAMRVLGLGLPLGAPILLGAIPARTNPVPAACIRSNRRVISTVVRLGRGLHHMGTAGWRPAGGGRGLGLPLSEC
jgi:sodium/hydrogen antiporter